VSVSVPDDGKACAQLGFAAVQRYFESGAMARNRDYEAAEHHLGTALDLLAPDDALRADVSFALGAIRVADHEARCARPCPAPAEIAPIVALLAPACAAEGAPSERLYPYAMTVDKLYEHTHDPADIDLAITWLRKAAGLRGLPAGDRRRAQISLAAQHANRGDSLRQSGSPAESRSCFEAAVHQFGEVLSDLARRGRRSDTTRDADRLDAWLGLLETYYQRGGQRPLDRDLDAMAGLARSLIAAMPADYGLRPYALARCGVLLIERISRRVEDSWDAALNTALQLNEQLAIGEAITKVNGARADLGTAIGALDQALGLESDTQRQPLLAAALCAARALRYLAWAAEEDLSEFGRMCRIVLGHPHTALHYRRSCGEFLLVVLAKQVRASGSGPAGLSASADADLDIMIGLLERFAEADGAGLDSVLSAALAATTSIRADGELSDAELTALCTRLNKAAAAFTAIPAARAMLLRQAGLAGAELARRGVGAGAGSESARADRGKVPAGLEVFSVRALALLGTASHGRLGVPPGRAAEALSSLPRSPAVLCVLGLAAYARWLRERSYRDLVSSMGMVEQAIGLTAEQSPLRERLEQLLAGMLLDRAQVHGDIADADAAAALLTRLEESAEAGFAPGDLNELLLAAGPPVLASLLAAPPRSGDGYRLELAAASGAALLLRAALSSAGTSSDDLLPPGGAGAADQAADILQDVMDHMPAGHPGRPAVLSDLGMARLAMARGKDTAGLDAMLAAVATCPPGHPHRAVILLRAAAALAAAALAGDLPSEQVRRGIDLLAQALPNAGTAAFGERSRCLYGFGYLLLISYQRTGETADLDQAISSLEEARAGLEPDPGDPFTIPLLRTLAWAYRQAGTRDRGLRRRRARSIGRSLQHAHASAVLLQSGPGRGIAAARSAGPDALRLVEWCVADQKLDSAVEALELGRALVLHAVTVTADIPALLRQTHQLELAAEWRAQDPGDDFPRGLRHRVLTALRNDPAEQRLFSAPAVSQVADALRATAADALVYLIPATAESSGRAMIVRHDQSIQECGLPGLSTDTDGPLRRFVEASRDLIQAETEDAADIVGTRRRHSLAAGELCDWAWTAAMGQVLDQFPAAPRLVIAPIGILGIVPWHAARRLGRYACADAVFTTCASARQFVMAAARHRRPAGTGPAVFVADPTGDLPWSVTEAEAARSVLYPDTVILGRSERAPVQGAGTAEEVLMCLSADGLGDVRPPVLHLGCHATAADSPERSHLVLADGELPVARILTQASATKPSRDGALVVLAACISDLTLTDHDEALTLASAFLAAGATGVVGSLWPVPDSYTATMMFMLHRHLVRNPADGPADALRAAQLWMLDPHRVIPAEMPEPLAAVARRAHASDPRTWAAFTYHGR
jgi:CHAT domain-containing protein